nr:TATA-box-binding protein-like [Aedes albopictus]
MQQQQLEQQEREQELHEQQKRVQELCDQQQREQEQNEKLQQRATEAAAAAAQMPVSAGRSNNTSWFQLNQYSKNTLEVDVVIGGFCIPTYLPTYRSQIVRVSVRFAANRLAKEQASSFAGISLWVSDVNGCNISERSTGVWFAVAFLALDFQTE